MCAVKRRRRGRRVSDDALTDAQWWELTLGPSASDARAFNPNAGPHERSAFKSPWHRRSAWLRHREAIMAEWLEDHPGQRPWAFWHYDHPDAREVIGEAEATDPTGRRTYTWTVREDDDMALVRLGFATEADLAEFIRNTEVNWAAREYRCKHRTDPDWWCEKWRRRKELYRKVTGREAPFGAGDVEAEGEDAPDGDELGE
ncbi:hypothetical protein [Caldinitratiruptor microaerophilus]|uniref:Uncharacterized protein n=1 Tax=Caldinitratiruptor microaerophilus TaxID=671077 RepID=A0AA35CJQ7_9FIRM|nr:hypothetical protein [Caldinitratiruptor microaerophilus]BDG59633.1 hypothetical protein caldi_07230 [Caldinitratiruptor microaerophilus]